MVTNTTREIVPGAVPRLIEQARFDPRLGILITVMVSALAGWISARVMPHGPATTEQALIVMLAGLVIGSIAGLSMRSRWAMVLAPLTHVVVIEIVRWGSAEPSIGAIRLDSVYGILALILGRGFYALVGLFPLLFGTSLGVKLSQPTIHPVNLRSWTLSLIMGIALIVLGVVIAHPASTPPIVGGDGRPLAGSIATLEKVRLGGADQWITIRGYSMDKPVLLYLSGGPGQSDLPFPRVLFDDLSRDFVVVGWDQRGTGKSYAALDPRSSLTLDQAIADTIELTQYLRHRFGEQKIYMLGESWGSLLGVLVVQRRPDLYYAWIGSGQMVSVRETDRQLYRDVIALAERTGDVETARQMRAYGEPPYADIPYANAFVMGQYDKLYKPYTPPQAYQDRVNAANLGFIGVMGSEYNFVDKVNVVRGLIDMFTVMYPQLQHIDFRRDVTRLAVPVYILDGQAELTSRRDLAVEWFDLLEAPLKRTFSFENAGHAVAFEQFEAMHQRMVDTVLPETYAPVRWPAQWPAHWPARWLAHLGYFESISQ